jgi:hypothetical protein
MPGRIDLEPREPTVGFDLCRGCPGNGELVKLCGLKPVSTSPRQIARHGDPTDVVAREVTLAKVHHDGNICIKRPPNVGREGRSGYPTVKKAH